MQRRESFKRKEYSKENHFSKEKDQYTYGNYSKEKTTWMKPTQKPVILADGRNFYEK